MATCSEFGIARALSRETVAGDGALERFDSSCPASSQISPAAVGPFDLGVVTVRTALHVNPVSAQGGAVSDPFPDLPGYPGADQGHSPQPAIARFQASDCASLGLRPKLAFCLSGGTHRGDFSALKATLTYPKKGAYANVAGAQVTLPDSELIENAHLNTICTRVQFTAQNGRRATLHPALKTSCKPPSRGREGPRR